DHGGRCSAQTWQRADSRNRTCDLARIVSPVPLGLTSGPFPPLAKDCCLAALLVSPISLRVIRNRVSTGAGGCLRFFQKVVRVIWNASEYGVGLWGRGKSLA